MVSSIEVDGEMLVLVTCPFCLGSKDAVGHASARIVVQCGACRGRGKVLYPASLIAEYKEKAA